MLDPARLDDLTLTNRDGAIIPLSQVGRFSIETEDPILRRRNRIPTITVESDIDERLQPPEVTAEIWSALKPTIASLPTGYHIEIGGNAEESAKANAALAPVFPVVILLTMFVLVVQVRSLSAMFMVLLTAPLGLIGLVPALLIFHQPFGFNGILGLIGLSGILMRNTLILIGQIHTNQAEGLDPYHAVVEATVQRARPVVLTALAAVLAFSPLTQSVFWGSLGLHADRWHGGGHTARPGLPPGALCDLVQNQAGAEAEEWRGCRTGKRDGLVETHCNRRPHAQITGRSAPII